jgi:replicative DNA helicase
MDTQIIPYSLEAEISLLGGCFLNSTVFARAKANLTYKDFYLERHQQIFRSMCKVGVDVVSIVEDLKKRGMIERIGGVDTITEIIASPLTSAGSQHQIDVIRDSAIRRRIIQECSNIVSEAHSKDLCELASNLKALSRSLVVDSSDMGDRDILMDVFQEIEDKSKSGNHKIGLETRIAEIDRNIGGLEPKSLTYLIGRPSMGKTALAIAIAENIALYEQGLVVFFSLEMGDRQIVRRRLAAKSNVFLSRLRHGDIQDSQWDQLVNALNELSKSKMLIVDSPKYKTIENLVALAESIAVDKKISSVFVDHIQLMKSNKKFTSRHLEISHVSNSLKDLAKELNIPVIGLCQLNREVEKRPNKRPQLFDLKECVVGGTNIAMERGLQRPIRNISKNKTLMGLAIKSYDTKTNQVILKVPEDVFSVGPKPCLRIRLKSGKMIEVSKGTKFWDGIKWVRADELKIGNRVCTDPEQKGSTRKGVHFNTGKTWMQSGGTSWNSGLTKDVDERVAKNAANTAKALKGKIIPKPKNYSEIMRRYHPPLGTKKNNRGYILLYLPDWPSANGHNGPWKGYVFEHRYVMEKHLGRSLTNKEIIHHINGDKQDNSLENLYLCRDSKEHQSIHIAEQKFVGSLIKEGKVFFDGNEFRFR